MVPKFDIEEPKKDH